MQQLEILVSESNYYATKPFTENFLVIKMKKKSIIYE